MKEENKVRDTGKTQAETPGKDADFGRSLIPNMILIAGDGRNVGKTSLAEYLLQNLPTDTTAIALKVTPHIHDITRGLKVLVQGKAYILAEETADNDKDTSRFLKAGAARSFLIMAGNETIEEAFREFILHLPDDALLIAEAGGLHTLVHPALFFFVACRGRDIHKKHYLDHNPQIITYDGNTFMPDIPGIVFSKGRIGIKQIEDGRI